MIGDKFMTLIRIFIVILNLTKQTQCQDTCYQEDSFEMLNSEYSYLPVCSSQHISDALRSDVTCAPVPVVISLPWPNNTDVQQMTPTHITVQRLVATPSLE